MRQGTDIAHIRELAKERRKLKAEIKTYRLRVIIDHLASGYTSAEIAQRLGCGACVVRDLVAELKRGHS